MSRSRYYVCYDVSDAKRLRRVFRIMNGFGEPLQYSVFACDLSTKERVLLEAALIEAINVREDRVLLIDIGPTDGRATAAVSCLGTQELPEERASVIV
jgi:CRISPR-associated protein Cas2